MEISSRVFSQINEHNHLSCSPFLHMTYSQFVVSKHSLHNNYKSSELRRQLNTRWNLWLKLSENNTNIIRTIVIMFCDVGPDFLQYRDRMDRSNHIAIMDQGPLNLAPVFNFQLFFYNTLLKLDYWLLTYIVSNSTVSSPVWTGQKI